jgi:ABC-type multidrug transport system ATPase subunit
MIPRLEVRALRGAHFGPVSFELAPGGLVFVRGPSGAGKSRLLRAIADLDPNEGEVRLDGTPREAFPPSRWRRLVGLLPAEPQWWAPLVREHFDPPPTTTELEALGLDPAVLERAVNVLSSGERQRLALLRLLVNRPRVLLLDEPTANLDPANTRRVERHVEALRGREGTGVVWVGHQPDQVERLRPDRVLELGGARRAAA